jgi:gliding motility-associated-like protein
LSIFDRFGELIYEGNDLNPADEMSGWDGTFKGKSLYPAVFAYVVSVEFSDGQVLTKAGNVTLLK